MNTKTALVVDDSKSARFAMRRFLENAGYRVEAVESAEEAFLALRGALPDVVFLDHVMPDIDGIQALDLLRADPGTASLPVVLCSSNEGAEFAMAARAHGAMTVLLKPPSPQQIADVLSEIEAATPAVTASMTPTAAPVVPCAAPPMIEVASPALSNKVHPIREPEVAIEQAVMKTLREALPAAPALRHASAPAPVFAGPRVVTPVTRPDTLRTEMESRLSKITGDLYAQLAETRAKLACLDGDIRREDEIRSLVSEVLDAEFARLTQQLESHLSGLRAELQALVSAQDARIERLGAALLESVSAEAHAVSERVVMNAASRISDQIAESILHVLKPDLARARG